MSILYSKKRLITPEQIDFLLNYESTVGAASVYRRSSRTDKVVEDGVMDRNHRSTSIKEMKATDDCFAEINQALVTGISSFGPQWIPEDYYVFEYNYLIYNVGDHFQWHKDQYIPEDDTPKREFSTSTILSLSDDLSGGDFEISSDDGWVQTVPLTVGETLFFKSTTRHKVNRLHVGKRISLVAWIGKK